MNFHPDMTDVQPAHLENGRAIGWIGKIREGFTWIVPNTTVARYGLMSIDPHTGNGNFDTRESALFMLRGMYVRPEPYGFKREDWN